MPPAGRDRYDDRPTGDAMRRSARARLHAARDHGRARDPGDDAGRLARDRHQQRSRDNHAKLTTAATFLARNKMGDIEDDILYDGFSSETENAKGTFKADGYDAVPLGDQHRTHRAADRHDAEVAGRGEDATQDSKDPMAMMTGFLGGIDEHVHRADPDRPAGVGAQGDGARVLGRERAPQSVDRGGSVPDRPVADREEHARGHGGGRGAPGGRRAGCSRRRRAARRPGHSPQPADNRTRSASAPSHEAPDAHRRLHDDRADARAGASSPSSRPSCGDRSRRPRTASAPSSRSRSARTRCGWR